MKARMAVILLGALVFAGCARLGSVSETQVAPKITLKKTLVCKGRDILWPLLAKSKDRQHVAYISPCSGVPVPLLNFDLHGEPALVKWFGRKYRIIADCVEGPSYDKIVFRSRILYSPDSNHLAFVARGTDGKWFVVLDGKEGKHYDAIAEVGMGFSDDSRHLSYYAVVNPRYEQSNIRLFPWDERDLILRGGTYIPIIDGVEGKPSDEPFMEASLFSPDGRRVAYPVKSEGKWSFIIDGVEGKQYDEVANAQFTPDSKQFVYLAKSGNKECVVVDGIEGPWYEQIGPYDILYVSAASHVALIAADGRYDCLVVDGVERQRCRSISNFTFSPDGQHYAYEAWLQKNDSVKTCVVVDSKEGNECGYVKALTFSPDSQRVGYFSIVEDKTATAVVDGVEGKQYSCGKMYDLHCRLVFSPDSKHVAYTAAPAEDEQFIVLDGVECKHYAEVAEPRFSPDSQRLAYVATTDPKHKSYFIVVDGKEYPAHPYLTPPVFSPDSQHVVYYACRITERWVPDFCSFVKAFKYRLIADGADTGWEYDELAMPGPKGVYFHSPNECRDIVRNGWNLYRVDLTFSE